MQKRGRWPLLPLLLLKPLPALACCPRAGDAETGALATAATGTAGHCLHLLAAPGQVMQKLECWIVEHRKEPRLSRLRRLVPTLGSFFTPLKLVDAFLEYDEFFALSRRQGQARGGGAGGHRCQGGYGVCEGRGCKAGIVWNRVEPVWTAEASSVVPWDGQGRWGWLDKVGGVDGWHSMCRWWRAAACAGSPGQGSCPGPLDSENARLQIGDQLHKSCVACYCWRCRQYIPPNFAEIRHILNIAQVGAGGRRRHACTWPVLVCRPGGCFR